MAPRARAAPAAEAAPSDGAIAWRICARVMELWKKFPLETASVHGTPRASESSVMQKF
jgi:hypothetical protein